MNTRTRGLVSLSLLIFWLPAHLVAGAPEKASEPDSRALKLQIFAPAATLVPGAPAALEFRLQNLISEPVHACIGSTEILFLSGGEQGGTIGGNISGGCCTLSREFLIPPGFALVWIETRDIPKRSVGEGHIQASLVICSGQDPVTGASKSAWRVLASSEKVQYGGR